MKYSKQREMIFRAVKDEPVHPTADTVYTKLKPENPNLSLGTVYRNLGQLCECGKLLRVQAPFGAEHYDGFTEQHYHMQCTSCYNVFDIPMSLSASIAKEVEQATGHHISEQTVTFSGICNQCTNKSKS